LPTIPDTFLKNKDEIDGIDLNQNNPDGFAADLPHFNESYPLIFVLIIRNLIALSKIIKWMEKMIILMILI